MMLKHTTLLVISITLALSACDKPADTTTAIDPSVAVPATPAPVAPAPVVNPVDTLSLNLAVDKVLGMAGVGEVVDNALVGTGKAGFLMYGPYASFQAGTYGVSIKGQVETLPEGKQIRLDVVSGKGTVNHGYIVMTQTGDIPAFEATLPEAVGDLEVRAQVAEGSKVIIQSYEITKKP